MGGRQPGLGRGRMRFSPVWLPEAPLSLPATAAPPGSDDLLQLAVAASHTGLYTWRVDDDVVTWTPECYRILGLPQDGQPLHRDSFFRRIHPEDEPRVA